MPLFACSQCGVIDNTALPSDYWYRVNVEKKAPLCTECLDGAWHGEFPRQTPDEAGLVPDDRTGFYIPPSERKQRRRKHP